jgi:hypothetical protein
VVETLSLRASRGRDLRGEWSNQCISCLKDSGKITLFTKSKIAREVGPRTPWRFVTNPSFNTIYVAFFHVPYVSYGKPGCSSVHFTISLKYREDTKRMSERLTRTETQERLMGFTMSYCSCSSAKNDNTTRHWALSLQRAVHKGCVQLPTTKSFNSQGSLIRVIVNDITYKPQRRYRQ